MLYGWLVIGLLMLVTVYRNRDWASEIAVWEDVAAKSPEKPRGHVNLGRAYMATRRPQEAVVELNKVLALVPKQTNDDFDYRSAAIANLASIYVDDGRALQAIEMLKGLPVMTAPMTTNLGVAYLRTNQIQKAAEVLSVGLQKWPDDFGILFNMGEVFRLAHRCAEANELYQRSYKQNIDIRIPKCV